jgi:hypothetical protein
VSPHCRYHCTRCSGHFTSLRAFDAHHEGSGEDHVPCIWPDLPEGIEWTERKGRCAVGFGLARDDVTVYALDTGDDPGQRLRGREIAVAEAQKQAVTP